MKPTKESSPPKGKRATHSKERLLKAAFEVFARNGFHGATTKMISTVAGVNESLITRHFQTKLGLFLSVIEKEFLPLETSLPYPVQETFSEELICYAEHMFTSNKKNGEILRILFGQALIDTEINSYIKTRIKPPYSKLFHERLEQLQKQHKLNETADLLAIQSCARDLALTLFLFSALLGAFDEKLARNNLLYFLKKFAAGFE
jgi:AcrR family transcriptional regulator